MVLGPRPILRNAIKLPGLNRRMSGYRSLIINYLRNIPKDGLKAKCKVLQSFPVTALRVRMETAARPAVGTTAINEFEAHELVKDRHRHDSLLALQ
jgi:hypothetical protein